MVEKEIREEEAESKRPKAIAIRKQEAWTNWENIEQRKATLKSC